ncbi:MAG: cyclopropane fatty acyl phospholipid synthase [Acidobacteriota bacterium]
MATKNAETIVRELLSIAGVTVSGSNPFDINVHNKNFYNRVLNDHTLGLGESYMDGWWDCEALDQLIDRILRAKLQDKIKNSLKLKWHILRSKLFNLQKPRRSFQVGRKHYDIGNNLFMAMLDKRMNYSCAYWKSANNLDEAQENKLELICKKLGLKPGMKILDLGCGWGSFARYAAEKFKVHVTGLCVSKNQIEYGRELCKGLPVELKVQDYRKADGKYDRVISIGFMEHVGYKNYRTYMKVVNSTLKENGISLLHTIGGNVSMTTANPFTTKYIFPNGSIPSITQLGRAIEGIFVVEDWHNFGPDYEKTLLAWYRNFEKSWPELKNEYNERFFRMWRYYLLTSAGGYRSRLNQLWQIVLTKPGNKQPDCRFS